MASDPFTYMHQAVWQVLENNQAFNALVPKRNRITFLSYTQPEALLNRTEADTPAVYLQLTKLQQAAVIATNTLAAEAAFAVQIITAGQNIEPALEILWTIAKAIEDANLQLPPHIVAMRFIQGEVQQSRLSQRLVMISGGTILVRYSVAWRDSA